MSEISNKSNVVLSRLENAVLTLGLNRPDKKNALNTTMYAALIRELDKAADDHAVKAVVVYGEGESFTAGNDLADFQSASSAGLEDAESPMATILHFLEVFYRFPKPIVLAVHGNAVGVGSTMLFHADMVFADSNARFAFPFVKLGLAPEYASSYLLPRVVGHAKAFEALVLGEPFNAETAMSYGMVNDVVSDPLEKATQVAQRLAALPASAVVAAKQLLKSSLQASIQSAMAAEVNQFTQALNGDDFKQAAAHFFNKKR